jgi:Domain of unknown function (4846)
MICTEHTASNFYDILLSITLPFLVSCQTLPAAPVRADTTVSAAPVLHKIADIALPQGYRRMDGKDSSFGKWLREIPIKADNKVYLYNGQLKGNQSAQYAVLDIPVGKKDLQQCADAVMRLRAEFFYGRRQYDRIWFTDNSGKKYTCPTGADQRRFEKYLEQVYSWCGTLSLEKQLKRVSLFSDIQPGDVLIKGGSPGHAVMVMDVAINKEGEKIYLLVQSYMPAQSIHILKNPMDEGLSPWYKAGNEQVIETPEWTFTQQQLRRW